MVHIDCTMMKLKIQSTKCYQNQQCKFPSQRCVNYVHNLFMAKLQESKHNSIYAQRTTVEQ